MKQLTVTFFFLALAMTLNAQQGIVRESIKLKSPILGKEVEYSIYLPSDYDRSNRRYPVLYLLHGFTDDETGWTQFGEVSAIADRTIGSGDAPAMIIVMPDAGVSWYVNSFDNKVRYEDFFVQELIPAIDATYRTRPAREFRAVAGLSMGGHGSLILAMKHPTLFSACAPLSAGIFTEEEAGGMAAEMWNNVFSQPYGTLTGKDRLNEHFYNNFPLKLVEQGNADELKKVRYYIDCGDDDFLIKGNMALHAAMIDKKIPHEFRVRDGAHNWTYWRTALPEVFKFVGESFHR